jgi:hypothetical protein
VVEGHFANYSNATEPVTRAGFRATCREELIVTGGKGSAHNSTLTSHADREA